MDKKKDVFTPPSVSTRYHVAMAGTIFKVGDRRGAWVAPSVKRLTLAQVLISWFTSSSPTSGSGLSAQSLEPMSDSVSPSLSAPSLLALCLFLSLKNK